MFTEFSRCSQKAFLLSLLTGAIIILGSAGLMAATGNALFLKAGLVLGLAGSRLAEAAFSHSCPMSRAGLEGVVLALVGVLLVAADDIITGLV